MPFNEAQNLRNRSIGAQYFGVGHDMYPWIGEVLIPEVDIILVHLIHLFLEFWRIGHFEVIDGDENRCSV